MYALHCHQDLHARRVHKKGSYKNTDNHFLLSFQVNPLFLMCLVQVKRFDFSIAPHHIPNFVCIILRLRLLYIARDQICMFLCECVSGGNMEWAGDW